MFIILMSLIGLCALAESAPHSSLARSWKVAPRGGSMGADSPNFFEPETEQGFQHATLSARPKALIVIDFGATWCGPCRSISPEFVRIAEQNAPFIEGVQPAIIFIKADVDKLPAAAAKYGIQSLPTFVFERDGVVLSKFSGASPQKLRDAVEKYR